MEIPDLWEDPKFESRTLKLVPSTTIGLILLGTFKGVYFFGPPRGLGIKQVNEQAKRKPRSRTKVDPGPSFQSRTKAGTFRGNEP